MQKSEIIEYYDNFLPYLKQDHVRHNQRHAKVKTKLSQLVKPGMTVLDLGCGTGITSKFMAQLGAKVTAVDISPKLIEFAKKESKHKNVKYICQDITDDNFNLKSYFHLITIIDCLEHISKKNLAHWNFMRNLMQHANKDTVIFLNIPDGRFQNYMRSYHEDKLQIIDESYDIEDLLTWKPRDDPDNFPYFGFEPIEIEIYGIDVPYQYNNYTFIHRDRLESIYKEALGDK